MTVIYNRKQQIPLRKQLRREIPRSESILWAQLKGRKINDIKFRRQHGIGNYVIDFYCPKLKLAIEIDGDSHYTDDAEIYDQKRTAYLEALGIVVVRFTNTEVQQNLDGVITEIQSVIVRMG